MFGISKVWLYIGIATVILGIVAGVAYYINQSIQARENKITELENTITQQRETISEHRMTIQSQNAAIESQENRLEQQRLIARQQEEINERLRQSDEQASQRVNELEQRLANREFQERFNIVQDERGSLLLRIMNRNAACQIENFGRTGGECIAGEWRSN